MLEQKIAAQIDKLIPMSPGQCTWLKFVPPMTISKTLLSQVLTQDFALQKRPFIRRDEGRVMISQRNGCLLHRCKDNHHE